MSDVSGMSNRGTLILAAHGAGDGSAANSAVLALAESLAAARRDLRVVTAFRMGTPELGAVLGAAGRDGARAWVLPVMTSDGYFAGEFLRGLAGDRAVVLPPIGVDARVTAMCVDLVRERLAVEGLAGAAVRVLVVGHGTRRSASSGAATEALARAIAAATGAAAQAAFLDQDPLLEDVAPTLGDADVLVVPFLLGGGGHHLQDIPERLARAERARVRVLPALADVPTFAETVRVIVDDAVGRPRVRLGTRGSRLALWQAHTAAAALRKIGAEVEVVVLGTRGDADQRTPLDAFATDGPFTDDLESALQRGEIDAAVHSLKDLPLTLGAGTTVAAVLARGAVEDVLVSRDGRTLRELPRGARVGTCSARRAAQVRRVRPDVVIEPIRGTVERRLAQVDDGSFDATVLALAGLARLGLAGRAAEVFPLDVMMPEAGQGAIAVQTRETGAAADMVALIDDDATRHAVEEERRATAMLEPRTGLIPSAVWRDGVLHVRVLSGDGRLLSDGRGATAEEAVEDLASRGRVWLVGAGPGDAGLITVKGLELLRAADVVVTDRQAGPALLEQARGDAEIIDAGKAPGRHTLTQEEINAVLVRRARAGLRVVRLKGGDPFIYGRGWEELEHCRGAGVWCAVVPGVTSAIAAAAAAEVPVTARGIARTLAIVTPQSESGAPTRALDYAALARMDTVSVLMGRAMLGEIADGLIHAGRDAETPVVVVQQGTLPEQRVVRGTLATITRVADEQGIAAPATVVIGTVAGLSAAGPGASAGGGPLAGKRVVVTRPRSASAGLIAQLRELGAEVIDCPLIRIVYTRGQDAEVLRRRHDWTVFTSLHGVRGWFEAVRSMGLDARVLGSTRLAAVGPKTAEALGAIGLAPDVVPEEHRAAALVREIGQGARAAGQTVLFPCGTLARDELRAGLAACGMIVHAPTVYDTLHEPVTDWARASITRGVDAWLFYCPSGVASAAAAGLQPGATDGAAVVCVGPTTARAAAEAGFERVHAARVHSDDGVLEELRRVLSTAPVLDEVNA